MGKSLLKNSKRILSADGFSSAFKLTGRKEGKLEGAARDGVHYEQASADPQGKALNDLLY